VATKIALYDSPVPKKLGGPWLNIGGTSASSPLIAGVYGLAGNAATVQPGNAYAHASVARADLVREPATDETAAVRWVPLDEAAAMIAAGDLAEAASVIGVQHALMLRAGVQLPAR
jgi:hypothetical protein